MSYLRFALLLVALLLPAAAQAQTAQWKMGPFVTASSGDTAAGVITATLAAPTSGSWKLTTIEINGTGATSGVGIPCTVTGLQGGTMTIDFAVIAGATLNNSQNYLWSDGLDGNPFTAIVASCPSFGTGNLHANITIHGAMVK